MLVTFVLVVHTLLAAGLVAVILLQRSEGGGLGIGGNTSGLVSARGAADLLTRTTAILATLFIGTSILLAVLYGQREETRRIDPTAVGAPVVPAAPSPVAPAQEGSPLLPGVPFAVEPGAEVPATDEQAAEGEVPLAQ